MTKAEVLEYFRSMNGIGFISHSMMLELYDDNEQIPDDFVDLMCYLPRPHPMILTLGAKATEEFRKAVDEFIKTKSQE